MQSIIKYILSIPITIWFNLRYLPFYQAIKIPICISYNTFYNISGRINIHGKVKPAMIRFGFHKVDTCDINSTTSIVIREPGILVFEGTAHIGKGSRISIHGGTLILGNNFAISGCSSINCYSRIVMGKDIQFAWDCLVMDSDTHQIFNEKGEICNHDQEVIIGDKVWIGCRTTILKGSQIPQNCVIGACSLICGKDFKESTIIAGNPAKSIRSISGWEL